MKWPSVVLRGWKNPNFFPLYNFAPKYNHNPCGDGGGNVCAVGEKDVAESSTDGKRLETRKKNRKNIRNDNDWRQ